MWKKIKNKCQNIKFKFRKIWRVVWHWICGIISKLPLALIITSCVIIMILLLYFLFNGSVNEAGEIMIWRFLIKLDLLDIIVSNISLLAAVLAIMIELEKPKLKVVFVNGHGELLNNKKGEVKICVDKEGYMGYPLCVPSDWTMYLVNVGKRAAQNIRVKISIDNILFHHSLVEQGYDLDNFLYGCGVFENIIYDLAGLLRQGEKLEIPRIPFDQSEPYDQSVLEKENTFLRILIYCSDQKPIQLKYKLKIEEPDCFETYNYANEKELKLEREQTIDNMVEDFINWYNKLNVGHLADRYNYIKVINPYLIKKYKEVDCIREVYEYYCERDIDKMLFWGRLYYRNMGLKLREIESLLQTDMIKTKIISDKPKEGKYYI